LHRIAFLTAAACLALPATTSGAVGSYTFDGGTKKERETVVAALEASSFDWTLLPGSVAIHIVHGEPSRSLPHEIWLEADLLDAGEFAWGVVQHEFAHQVDYLLLDDAGATQRAVAAARATAMKTRSRIRIAPSLVSTNGVTADQASLEAAQRFRSASVA
jgi:hypothetical protein